MGVRGGTFIFTLSSNYQSGSVQEVSSGPLPGKQDWRCGMYRKANQGTEDRANKNPLTMWMAPDSRTGAMEVGIREGVCNNSLAEATRSENGQC